MLRLVLELRQEMRETSPYDSKPIGILSDCARPERDSQHKDMKQ
jgi:hypothetical protein